MADKVTKRGFESIASSGHSIRLGNLNKINES